MTDLSVLDMNIDDIVEPREAPDGEYIAQVSGVKFDRIPNEKQTPYADLEFKLISPQGDQDLTGVNLNRPVLGRLWLSKDAVGGAKRDLKKFGVDVSGLPLKEAFEKVIGETAVVKVIRDDYAAKKGRDRAIIQNWRAA